jgi:ABC-type multidrug transport system fused ATPase/permease subunit
MIIVAGLALALPAAIQYMIDDLIPSLAKESNVDVRPVFYFGLFLAGIYFLNVVFSALRDYLAARIGAAIIVDIRSELFNHLQRVSLRFYQRSQVGEIMSRLLSDVARIQDLLTTTMLVFFTNIFLLLAILIYILRINWILSLIALIPVPLTILLSNRFGKRLHVISRRLQEAVASISARLQEAFTSTRVIRAFGQEDTEQKRVHRTLDHLRGLQVNASVVNSLAHNFIHFVNMVGPVVVLAWGTYLVAGGKIQLGALIAFYILLGYLYSPIKDLASVNVEVQSAMASVNRIFEYLDLPSEIEEVEHPVVLRDVKGAITLNNVRFAYGDNGFRFEDLSLEIRPGEKIAVVGPSGSGKTTLVNLIMRFFDPASGEISLDGVDIRRLSVVSLRSRIGLVDQDPLLFRASIFDNIAFGDPSAGLERVIEAAKVANIHDFISNLPEGYDTQVGERGVTLSGGEKQRVCLARAILRDPPIVILDEATSALDSNSEQLIQESLKRILVKKTAIIIAHRLATIQHADRIVALDRGQIVDQGRHEELLDRSPLYRELASKQLML